MYIAKSVDNGESWKSYLINGGVSANDLIVESNNIFISYQDSYGLRVPEFWGRTTFGKNTDN